MIKQAIFPVSAKEEYKKQDFITSKCNQLAYQTITTWPTDLWGVAPYDTVLLLTGPSGSGKTFLANIWLNAENPEQTPQVVAEDIDEGSYSEEELLHIFNDAYLGSKYLLLTSTKAPSIKLPDLASRINAIRKIEITAPDDELLEMLIFKLFSTHSVKISSEVVSFLLKVLPRDFQGIQKAIERINSEALSEKRKITIPFIKEVLG